MILFLNFFMILIYFYQIINTVFVYGLFDGKFQLFFSVFKEFLRFFFFIILIISNFQVFVKYIKKYILFYILLFVLTLRGFLVSYLSGIDFSSIIIGFKYNIYFFFIILSSIFVGNILREKGYDIKKLLSYFVKSILLVLVLGFLRQGLKFIFPDFFYSIGYGNIGDFNVGQKPPIYYRTGHDGLARLSGIFSGPNNYGYFLVLFFSFFVYYFTSVTNFVKRNKYIAILIYILSVILTFSRGAFVGIGVQLYFLLKQSKRFSKKILIFILVVILSVISGFSILKGSSTMLHLTNSNKALQMIIDKPFGYGLGVSGPSSHYTTSMNVSIIPENIYLQILIDMGFIGFVLRTLFLVFIFISVHKLKREDNYIYLNILFWGLIGLLVEGLFLHVFEDSMINYLFFSLFGILIGYIGYTRDK